MGLWQDQIIESHSRDTLNAPIKFADCRDIPRTENGKKGEQNGEEWGGCAENMLTRIVGKTQPVRQIVSVTISDKRIVVVPVGKKMENNPS